MTDRSRYSNVSLSHATYEVLKKLSSKLLPGNTPLSISKTVETLALEKMQKMTNQNQKRSGIITEYEFKSKSV